MEINNKELTQENSREYTTYKADSEQYMTFTLGDGTYGLNVNIVKEVIGYEKIFSIPRVPEYMRGIINLRGEVIPVVDLNYLFFNKKNEITKFTCILILELEEDGKKIAWGLLIDSVQAVVSINDGDVKETPGFSLNLDEKYVSNVAGMNDEFVILLNIEKILDISELGHFSKIK